MDIKGQEKTQGNEEHLNSNHSVLNSDQLLIRLTRTS